MALIVKTEWMVVETSWNYRNDVPYLVLSYTLTRPFHFRRIGIAFIQFCFHLTKKNNCNFFRMLNRFVFKHQKLETYFAAQFWTDIVSTPTRFENGTWNQFNNKKNSLLLVHLKTWFATLNSHNGRRKRREKLEVALYTRKRSRGGKKTELILFRSTFRPYLSDAWAIFHERQLP